QGQHRPPGPAADLGPPPRPCGRRRQAYELPSQGFDNFRRAGEELPLVLIPAAKRRVVVGILPRTAIPVLAHPLDDAHVPIVSACPGATARGGCVLLRATLAYRTGSRRGVCPGARRRSERES